MKNGKKERKKKTFGPKRSWQMCNEYDRYRHCLNAPFVDITTQWMANKPVIGATSSLFQYRLFFFLFFLVAFRGDKMKKISIEIRSTNCTMKSVKLRITIKYKYALLFWITYSASTHSMAHSTINWHTFFPIEERKKKSHTIKSFSIFAF